MNAQPPQPPWSEHRMLAEKLAQGVADSLTIVAGTHVELGKSVAFDPEAVIEGRPLPLRGFVVRFRRPLRDVAVFLTSLKDEAIRPYVERSAQAIVESLDMPGQPDEHGPLGAWEIEEVAEFEELDLALEQCDALFLEASYSLDLPNAELTMVLGTGLLESASCFVEGIADPFTDEAPFVPEATELELGDAITVDAGERYELGDDLGLPGGGDVLEVAAGSPAAPTSSIDDYDALLAAQEAQAADAAAATARANVAAAELPDLAGQAAEQRWTDLLSGVEVELSAELGRAQLALGDITSLTSDSVLTLDQLVHEPVTVYVNGTPYATARLVIVDGEYGIEILTVVEQQQQGSLVTSLAAA